VSGVPRFHVYVFIQVLPKPKATPPDNVTDAATGIMLLYQSIQPETNVRNYTAIFKFGVPYFSISVALNVLLTLMIVVRLILHSRKIQNAIGATARASRLYKAVVAMLVEACALYAVSSLLYIGPWSTKNYLAEIFLPILAETQVRTVFAVLLVSHNQGY
jgi:hypothetical protein